MSLFKFPKDRVLSQKWIRNVQKTRANWDGPSEHSVLCSQHCDSSCFEVDSELAAQMGIQKCRRLKPDVVPTVFDRPAIQLPSLRAQSEPGPSRVSRKGALYAAHHLLIQLLRRLEQPMRRERDLE